MSLASMYEAMAERIRAGEAEATVLADYGLMRAAHPAPPATVGEEDYAEAIHATQCISPAPGHRMRPWSEVDETHKAGDRQDAADLIAFVRAAALQRAAAGDAAP